MSDFTGFEEPQANYSKLPHALIDELNNINSVSELKVILYILRHTWGFRDADKKITIDEFCTGRKRADGSRMDGGCGIHPNSVRAGLDAAIEHGYILVEEDARDLARIKRRYSINSRGSKLVSRGAKVEPLGGAKVEPLRSKVAPRTEKETTGKIQEKETEGEKHHPLPGEEKAVPAPYPALKDMDKIGTVSEWANKRGKALKHCDGFVPQKHTAIFDAIVDIMGVQALVDADDTQVIGDYQEVSVILEKAGQTAERIESLKEQWKTTWPGKDGGSLSQLKMFLVRQSAKSQSEQMVKVRVLVRPNQGDAYHDVVSMPERAAREGNYEIVKG